MTTMTQNDSEFLTIAEAAELLHVSKLTVRRRIASGELDAVKLGTGPKAPVRIASGDLVAYVRRVNA